MMNFRVIISLLLSLFLISCGGKEEPDGISTGINIIERAIDYHLKGDELMSEYTYSRALTHFRNMGRFCDMARVSINIYISDPNEENIKKVDDAIAFAVLGNCEVELNIGNFLKGNDYNYTLLKEPYKSYAKFLESNKVSTISGIASSNYYNDRIKSVFYRLMAKAIIEDYPKKALSFINDAMKIDSKHSWTKNVLYNEMIQLDIYKKLGYDTKTNEERINILKDALQELNK